MKLFIINTILLFLSFFAFGQKFHFRIKDTSDVALDQTFTELAKKVIQNYQNSNKEKYFDNLFRLQITTKQYEKSIITIDSFCNLYKTNSPETAKAIAFHYRIYAATKLYQSKTSKNFMELFDSIFYSSYNKLTEPEMAIASRYFDYEFKPIYESFKKLLINQMNKDSINYEDAKEICRAYNSYIVNKNVLLLGKKILKSIDSAKFIIEDSVLIKMRDGATVAATVIRNRNISVPQAVIFNFTIYPSPSDKTKAKMAVNRGYIGVVANTRGKRLSPQNIEPFEHDANDAYDIIDWISKQSWCSGKVGMYGSSYSGFSQWAAVKNIHPALKTIVPQASVGIGIDFPMQNNIFKPYMLKWIHYVSNNKLTDDNENNNRKYWYAIYKKWYASGKSFRSLDTIEGRPSLLFNRWLQHPSFDNYWQNMSPYQNDFSQINIPILTTTGYYDDDQLGAMYYLREHYKFNKNANHYLLIGPYDHAGAQGSPSAELNGYKIDAVANVNINDLVFKWFDYILKDSIKPAILKDKINYEVMGSNEWKHAPSIDKVSNDTLQFYFSNIHLGKYYKLLSKKPFAKEFIRQELDYLYHGDTIDNQSDELISKTLEIGENIPFISDPLESSIIINGSFFGEIKSIINKKDFDLNIQLYEQLPDGSYFNLSNFLGRASYAKDRNKRQLLKPGKEESIPYSNSLFTSRKLSEGSRLIVLVGINKNEYWQVNYGTGKDVSAETIKDGKNPLQIQWFNDSYLKIPIWRN